VEFDIKYRIKPIFILCYGVNSIKSGGMLLCIKR